ncbi:bifunctional NAD(P)H-hydrate repair enzyme Nnr [mine drainage metagenome]|uniref:Nicotinamide nucleotide repair protein n=1 Tax=mine drainage metagenome TaxID=410659 RepID=A0A1J5QCM7_9ZZZZ
MQKITPGSSHPLYGVAQTRQIELLAATGLPANALMQRAGLGVARLALAIAPHAHRIWIACGSGNNGGDGLECALHLHLWGKQPVVTWLGHPAKAPMDTAVAYQRLLAAGVAIEPQASGNFDLCIDALLGIGTQAREPEGLMANWMARLNAAKTLVLSVDIPSGLNADTGQATRMHVRASHTLSLLTLKPGLFTCQGRDAVGTLWHDDLRNNVSSFDDGQPQARLVAQPTMPVRLHASHKGTFGDVAVVGGAAGMTGAALLAASAALHAGAGRVFVGLLDGCALNVDTQQTELMFRPLESLDFSAMTVVCGCGGGTAVQRVLPSVMVASKSVVFDADAINSIALDASLQSALIARSARGAATILTPHPLEAARLLGLTAGQIQNDRLSAAHILCQRFGCTVVLKGSGTVIAAPGQIPMINPTGNARLATAGSGDVLAGMIGARLAAGMSAFDAACHAVYRHGERADNWPVNPSLTAGLLARLSA